MDGRTPDDSKNRAYAQRRAVKTIAMSSSPQCRIQSPAAPNAAGGGRTTWKGPQRNGSLLLNMFKIVNGLRD